MMDKAKKCYAKIFKVCSQILGTDFFVRNTSFAFDGFPQFFWHIKDSSYLYRFGRGKKSKKNCKGGKNEEENLGVRQPLTFAPQEIYQHASKFKPYPFSINSFSHIL